VEFVAAQTLISEESAALSRLAELPDMTSAVTSGLQYIKYLNSTWMTPSLWQGWSQRGRIHASELLKIPIEGVIPTTNHLEAFNCVLKRKHVHRWQRAGKRLRFDLFIFLVITQILPGIFSQRNQQQAYLSWLSARFQNVAGGVDLVSLQSKLTPSTTSTTNQNQNIPATCWSSNSKNINQKAAEYIVAHSRIDGIAWTNTHTVIGSCASSTADIRISGHKRYNMWMTTYGFSFCACPEFSKNYSACKHLWALHLQVLGTLSSEVQGFYFANKIEEVCDLNLLLLYRSKTTTLE
jgi:hypothetical protein